MMQGFIVAVAELQRHGFVVVAECQTSLFVGELLVLSGRLGCCFERDVQQAAVGILTFTPEICGEAGRLLAMDGEINMVTSCEMDGFNGGLLTLARVHAPIPQLVLLTGT